MWDQSRVSGMLMIIIICGRRCRVHDHYSQCTSNSEHLAPVVHLTHRLMHRSPSLPSNRCRKAFVALCDRWLHPTQLCVTGLLWLAPPESASAGHKCYVCSLTRYPRRTRAVLGALDRFSWLTWQLCGIATCRACSTASEHETSLPVYPHCFILT